MLADRAFRWLLVLCGALTLVPLWAVKYLPMTDLPEHAAQVAAWRDLSTPGWPFADLYTLNLLTPYLLSYCLVRAVSLVLPVLYAIKVVLSAALLLVPLVTLSLLRRAGGERYAVFLIFPGLFGGSYYWGLFPFLVALPLGLLLIDTTLAYHQQPDRQRGLLMVLLALLTLTAHLMALALCGLAAGLILLSRRPLGQALRRALPLLGVAALGLLWVLLVRSEEPMAREPVRFVLDLSRPVHLSWALFGVQLTKEPDAIFLLQAALALLVPVAIGLLGLRFAGPPARWLPLAVVLLAFLLGPHQAMGHFLLYSRGAALILPLLVFALDSKGPTQTVKIGRALSVAIAVLWLGAVTARGVRFDRQARDFDAVLAQMEPGRTALSLPLEPLSEHVPQYPFVHFPAWYQVQKGGRVDSSFASYYNMLVRYRPDFRPAAGRNFEWNVTSFRWARHGGYDYFVVRARMDVSPVLFPGADVPVRLLARQGMWWLYRR